MFASDPDPDCGDMMRWRIVGGQGEGNEEENHGHDPCGKEFLEVGEKTGDAQKRKKNAAKQDGGVDGLGTEGMACDDSDEKHR